MAQANMLRKAKSLFSTTLSTGISTGTGDTITPNSVTGLPTDTEITLTFDRIDSGGTATPSKMERITGTISGGNLINYTRAVEGTEQAHASGCVIEYIWNADDWNDHVDHHLVEHNDDGTHANVTASTVDIGSSVAVTATLDEDDMASNSATALATQQSIKAYVDSGTVTMTNKTLTSPVTQGLVDGWTLATDTWTYASASTFTIAGVDRTTVFTKGTRLKFTQTTVKYAVVVSSSFSTNTTVTIAVNTDYTIANAAITSPYYSYQACPAGYPNAFTLSAEQKLSITGTLQTIWGWGFNAGNGNWYTTGKTVTYGRAFATAPSVSGSCIGQKTGSDPTTIGDFAAESLCMFSPEAITTSQFSAAVGNTNHSTAVGATQRIGYAWIAIGTI